MSRVCYPINLPMQSIKDLITIDPETIGGQPVFKGTRVPVESLFNQLEDGISLEEFDMVSKDLAIAEMELASKFLSKNIDEWYAKEPAGVDFFVDPKPLTAADRKRISEIITYSKITGLINSEISETVTHI